MAWALKEQGIEKVRALSGGFEAWEKAGYPLEPKNQRQLRRR
ncbi:MAG: rhodanese-like domain-containing protein [Acidobacteriota bacterium]|jgi:3-mercaptopyruvate sulfurtransferase SseA